MSNHHELGPLLTISDDELTRPARRREDRDVLILRIEIEAQRREVARLMSVIGRRLPVPDESRNQPLSTDSDKLLLSARELRHALGVSNGAIYRWVKEGLFPAQIHVGSLARWKKSDVDAWLQDRSENRTLKTVASERPPTVQRVRGGRSRWAATTASTPGYVRNWEPRRTPLRGVGWKLKPGVPEPVATDHPDYTVPRYRLDDAARYVGLKGYQQWDLHDIPHGRTKAMHYCFAQSDLDAFKATLGTRIKKKIKSSRPTGD